MCIGLPMQVIEAREGFAVCRGQGETRHIDMKLVGDQPEGTWVLVFIDAAREVVTADHASAVSKALRALDLAMSGLPSSQDIDALFPDLADREPQLPEHLKPTTIR
ncbi:MAG: HypC/HybG/HupF family hydrogenase formation chaperone [Hyphomicrobiaceae bacterium]